MGKESISRLEDALNDSDEKVSMKWAYSADGLWTLVGNGLRSREDCGKFAGFVGCPHSEQHGQASLEGENHAGQVYVQVTHHFCHKSTCSLCFELGWALEQAKEIEFRITEASKQFGEPEHIIISPPLKVQGKDFEVLRRDAAKAAFRRGVVGGSLLFHYFRYDPIRHWYQGLHFHCIGFLKDGYGKCRRCKYQLDGSFSKCRECSGFEGITRRLNKKDGYVVKVADASRERQTVFGTAYYELKHASVKVGVPRFRPVSYFGTVSYRKLRISGAARKRWDEEHKPKCPSCGSDLVRIGYAGVRSIVTDRSAVGYQHKFWADFLENGFPAWYVKEGV